MYRLVKYKTGTDLDQIHDIVLTSLRCPKEQAIMIPLIAWLVEVCVPELQQSN